MKTRGLVGRRTESEAHKQITRPAAACKIMAVQWGRPIAAWLKKRGSSSSATAAAAAAPPAASARPHNTPGPTCKGQR